MVYANKYLENIQNEVEALILGENDDHFYLKLVNMVFYAVYIYCSYHQNKFVTYIVSLISFRVERIISDSGNCRHHKYTTVCLRFKIFIIESHCFSPWNRMDMSIFHILDKYIFSVCAVPIVIFLHSVNSSKKCLCNAHTGAVIKKSHSVTVAFMIRPSWKLLSLWERTRIVLI